MFTWLKDPSGIGMWLFLTLLVLVICCLLSAKDVCGDPVNGSAVTEVSAFADADDVEGYLRWFLRGVRRGKRWDRARELSELIVTHSKDIDPVEHKGTFVHPSDIDPLKVAVNMVYESSLKVRAKGTVGELGLPQIHPKNVRALYRSDGSRFDLQLMSDAVEAGARWLAYCEAICRDLEATYSAYKTGSCRVVGAGEFRAREYRKARTRLGLSPIS